MLRPKLIPLEGPRGSLEDFDGLGAAARPSLRPEEICVATNTVVNPTTAKGGLQLRPEHLEVDHRGECLELVADIAQPLQPLIHVKQSRMLLHPDPRPSPRPRETGKPRPGEVNRGAEAVDATRQLWATLTLYREPDDRLEPRALPGRGDRSMTGLPMRSAMAATIARPSPLPSVLAPARSKRAVRRLSVSGGTTGPSFATVNDPVPGQRDLHGGRLGSVTQRVVDQVPTQDPEDVGIEVRHHRRSGSVSVMRPGAPGRAEDHRPRCAPRSSGPTFDRAGAARLPLGRAA